MRVLITGGGGLVGSNLARRVLRESSRARVTLVDRSPPDQRLVRFLADGADRVDHCPGDIRDPSTWRSVPDPSTITHVVHAAAIAHVPEWEQEDPGRYFDVNLGGTLAVCRWAGALRNCDSLLYVSTGGVYGSPCSLSPDGPQPEDGPLGPSESYGISKYAAELASRRIGELVGLDVFSIRLSAVFGPMERPTAGRALMSLPYMVARAIVGRKPLRLTERTLAAAGDFLSGEDVAAAVNCLLTASERRYPVYNVAFGRLTTVTELLEAARRAAPELRVDIADSEGDADFDMDPSLVRARWNAYDIQRVRSDTGWAPRPLPEQFASYLSWLKDSTLLAG